MKEQVNKQIDKEINKQRDKEIDPQMEKEQDYKSLEEIKLKEQDKVSEEVPEEVKVGGEEPVKPRKRKKRLRPEYETEIVDTVYPGIGITYVKNRLMHAKNTFPGQVILGRHLRSKQGIAQLTVLEKIKKAPWEVEPKCVHYSKCGGCMSQEVPYPMQVSFKEKEVLDMIREADLDMGNYHGIHGSEEQFHYRNKMEFTFGDEVKGGPLSLGMHMPNKRNSIITVDQCQLVSRDFNRLLVRTLDFFKGKDLPYYRILSHEGTLRNLIVREAKNTGELMAILVAATDPLLDAKEWAEDLLKTELDGKLTSIYHITNDSFQDAVVVDKMELIYGEPVITEILNGMKFKISPMSFFQTNPDAAERLYQQVIDFAGDISKKEIFDLYCGTGTIGNILAPHAKHVTGVELIEEAVEMAKENTKLNGNDNTTFIAGDVKDVIADLQKAPDLIVVDPPRSGIHSKALDYLRDFKAQEIIYVSCNPKTMIQDLLKMEEYIITDFVIMDNFPNTNHCEIVALLSRVDE